MDLLDAARDWAAAGFSVVPVAVDGSKSPAVAWKQYQTAAADTHQLEIWFGEEEVYDGFGIVCGAVSGHLEMLEAEDRAVADGTLAAFHTALKDNGYGELWERLNQGCLEHSPSGGLHWLFRVDGAARPNTKLARRPATAAELVANSTDKVKVLLETRGEGGFVVVAPSGGRTHPTGKPWVALVGDPDTVPVITVAERDALYAIAAMFDLMPVPVPEPAPRETWAEGIDRANGGNRPGDDYNARASWDDILEGWTRARTYGSGCVTWVRPGKDPRSGISATTGRNDGDNLYVFSSSTPFETERPYSKFGAYTLLHHGGDYAAAAKELRSQGFGAPPPQPRLPDPGQPEAGRRKVANAHRGEVVDGTATAIAPKSLPSATDTPQPPAPMPDPVEPMSLDEAHAVFRRWLGKEFEIDALNAVLAAAAVERLDGDPLWLLLISGSGNAKTETVQALDGIGAIVTSTISSDGALLSATSRKERDRAATGGLLRKLGDHGVLVLKDVTSILSMDRNTRGMVLAALREVYDGRWSRNVGTDGGMTLSWAGRIAVVGAVTTAWDRAHEAVAAMGDRFMLLRMDSTVFRLEAGRQAIGNTGQEAQMRTELAAAVAGVLAGANTAGVTVTPEETELLMAAADLVTRARTAVEFDYKGDVIDSHAPEMPTRFAKQLTQMLRGAVAVGLSRRESLRLAIRCARDSMPPLRLLILDDVARHPSSTTTEVRRRLNKPRATVDRQLQALQILGIVTCSEQPLSQTGTRWLYAVADDIDAKVLTDPTSPRLVLHTQ